MCVPVGEWERISQTQEIRRRVCECGNELGMDERESFPFQIERMADMPNYCSKCGRQVVV